MGVGIWLGMVCFDFSCVLVLTISSSPWFAFLVDCLVGLLLV